MSIQQDQHLEQNRHDLRCDVAVVGAGVIGLSIAWYAARAGLSVRIYDPVLGRPVEAAGDDGGASWSAAGMLAPVTEVHYGEESLLTLNRAAADSWPGFVADLESAAGLEIGYRTSGTLSIARDGDDMAALDELATYQDKLGLDVERLRARQARQLEPALSPRIRGGLLVRGDHSVDNRALVRALRAAVAAAGVSLVAEAVTDLRSLDAATVVVAAGASSGRLLPGLPVRPVKGQLLHLRGSSPLIGRTVRGEDVYLVPRADGRLVAGASVEEQGFDRRVTAGAVHELLRAARELLPDVDELELVGTAVGLRPGSPDNAPLLGTVPVPDGSRAERIVVASGHYRNGVLLTPLTGQLVTDLLRDGTVPALMEPFSPGRFGSTS
ncbi:MAG: glycine oxidase [Frankiaceae bacterium]|nr:glycine oxidase [Frankiaceae bacterium]